MIKRSTVIVGALALLICTLAQAPAWGVASIVNVGWWSQRPGATEQPAGGFELAFGPTGSISEAAVRLQIDVPQLSSALLELTESEAAGAEVASVLVCPTSDTWAPANPGAWDERPTANCAKNVPLSRRSTGEWAGDISELLTTGIVSVVLVPMSHTDTRGVPVPYQITFSAATLQASAPATPAPEPPPFSPGSDFTPPTTDQPRTVSAPDSPPSGNPGGPPAVVSDDESEESDDDFGTSSATDDDDDAQPKAWWRLAILVPVAALLGSGAVFVRRTATERGWTG